MDFGAFGKRVLLIRTSTDEQLLRRWEILWFPVTETPLGTLLLTLLYDHGNIIP